MWTSVFSYFPPYYFYSISENSVHLLQMIIKIANSEKYIHDKYGKTRKGKKNVRKDEQLKHCMAN